jgi:hypothetical protein
MSLSLKNKVERAFAEYLPTVLTVGGLNIYEGHTPPDDSGDDPVEVAFPALVIYAESSDPHPDMPAEMGIKDVLLRCRFYVESEGVDRDETSLDLWKHELEEQMRTIDDIQAALNKPESGSDTRTYKEIHFHHVEPASEPSDREGQDWVEELSFTVTVEPLAA